jgi:hypothetical protein
VTSSVCVDDATAKSTLAPAACSRIARCSSESDARPSALAKRVFTREKKITLPVRIEPSGRETERRLGAVEFVALDRRVDSSSIAR